MTKATKLNVRDAVIALREAADRVRTDRPGILYADLVADLRPVIRQIREADILKALRLAGIVPPRQRVKITRTVRGRTVTKSVSPARAAAITREARRSAKRGPRRLLNRLP